MKDFKNINFRLFDTVPNQYLILSPTLHILNASDRYLEAVGKSREQIVEQYIFDAFPINPNLPGDDGLHNIYASLKKVLETKRPHKMAIQRYDVPAEDGRFIRKYWDPEHVPVLGENNEIVYIIQHVEDITKLIEEKEKTETLTKAADEIIEKEKLKKLLTEEQQKSIYNLSMESPSALALLKGKDFVVEFANHAICQMWDREHSSIIGTPLFELLPEVKGQGFEQLLDEVMRTGLPYIGKEMPGTLKRKGVVEKAYFTFAYNPIFGENGEVTGIEVIAEEVTDSIKMREALQYERAILQSALTHLPAIVCIQKGPNHIYEYVNPAYEKTLGSRPLIGKTVREALPEVEGQGFFELLDNVYHTGEPYIGNEVPIMIKRKSETLEQAYFNFVYQPMYDDDRNIVGIFTFAYEVTDQVDARNKVEKANEQLQKLNTEFKFVMDFMPQFVWSTRPDGHHETFNKVVLEYMGVSLEDALGDGWSKVLHPDDFDRTFKIWNKALQTGNNYEIEYRLKKYDGTYRWFLARAVPLKKHDGEIIKWFGTCTDIHDQKEIQESLKMQAHVLQSMNEGVCLVDENGVILYTNPAEDRMLGYAPGALIGKNVTVKYAYTPEENQKIVNSVIEELKKKNFLERQWRNIKKDGTIFITSSAISTLEFENKTLFVYVQKDVTEELKNKADLEYQSKLNKTITDNTTSALFMMNDKGYCTFMNPAVEKMLGYTFDEISQRPIHYMIHHHRPDGSFYPMEECPIDKALPENFDLRAHEDVFIKKDETFFPVLCSASPIFQNGIPIATVVEVRDITKEKEAKTEIEKSNIQLQKQNEDLVRINNDLDNFIYTASHDLKAPVSNIEGLLTTMLDTLSEESKKDQDFNNVLDLIKKSIDRFKHTILDLTEISKVQKEAQEDISEIDCQEILEDVKISILDKIKESGGKVEFDFSSCRSIRFSRKNLKSVIYNLLSNAVKYRDPKKELRIVISTKKEKDFTMLSVKDNGLGISEANKGKLFTMFKRFHDHVEGTGIGLYIVKRIIDNSGGKIEVHSEEGKGTEFDIYFRDPQLEKI